MTTPALVYCLAATFEPLCDELEKFGSLVGRRAAIGAALILSTHYMTDRDPYNPYFIGVTLLVFHDILRNMPRLWGRSSCPLIIKRLGQA